MPQTATREDKIRCGMMMAAFLLIISVPACLLGKVWFHSDRHVTPMLSVPTNDMDINRYCLSYGFVGYRFGPRKVYDLFLISDELDWLEIRLNTLSPHVDYFVIVESNMTFTGEPKPLHLKENWSRFSAFHGQIIHHTIEDPTAGLETSSWSLEEVFGNALLYSTFPPLMFTEKEAKEGDVLVVGNVDEIPKPATLFVLRNCHVPDRINLNSDFYQNSFQWLHINEQWAYPQATVFHGMAETISPVDLRGGVVDSKQHWTWWTKIWSSDGDKADLWDAAWYCKACSNETVVEKKVEGGNYTRIENNTDVPRFVLDNPKRFGYMLD